MSIFQSTQGLDQPDPILGLATAFRTETRPNKVNLGIGVYQTFEGLPYVFPSVRQAEKEILSAALDKEYAPIEGVAALLEGTIQLVFGEGALREKIGIVQTVGATAALRIGGEYLALQGAYPLFVSEPTWPNHKTLFAQAGCVIKEYPYVNPETKELDFAAVCHALTALPEGSGVLLHACCHNPTGLDFTEEQWRELATLIGKQKLFPFFDLSYQGFGASVARDAWPIRHFAEQGLEFFIAYSFAKNFGLYGERVGALIAVCQTAERAQKVTSQLKTLIRRTYSSPPLHGARIASNILHSQSLKAQWEEELRCVRESIQKARQGFLEGLKTKGFEKLTYLEGQRGLFSYGLLQPSHVALLKSQYAIYLPTNGRINLAGLNEENREYVLDAINAVMHER